MCQRVEIEGSLWAFRRCNVDLGSIVGRSGVDLGSFRGPFRGRISFPREHVAVHICTLISWYTINSPNSRARKFSVVWNSKALSDAQEPHNNVQHWVECSAAAWHSGHRGCPAQYSVQRVTRVPRRHFGPLWLRTTPQPPFRRWSAGSARPTCASPTNRCPRHHRTGRPPVVAACVYRTLQPPIVSPLRCH